MLPALALSAMLNTAPADDAAAIRTAIDAFIEAYNAGDVDRLMTVYAPDFIDMSQGERTLPAEEAHRLTVERLRKTFQSARGLLTVTTDEIVVQGSLAFDRGTLEVRLTDRTTGTVTLVRRRFLEIWRKRGDGWKVWRAMDNEVP